jgi:hypothetical protein
MNTESKQTTTPVNVSRIIGYILLVPPLLSILLFLGQLFSEDEKLERFGSTLWTGSTGGGAGGYTSALPFYFGLMAIAGAYLIKDRNKNV